MAEGNWEDTRNRGKLIGQVKQSLQAGSGVRRNGEVDTTGAPARNSGSALDYMAVAVLDWGNSDRGSIHRCSARAGLRRPMFQIAGQRVVKRRDSDDSARPDWHQRKERKQEVLYRAWYGPKHEATGEAIATVVGLIATGMSANGLRQQLA